ncbi:UDP-N-acetylglucosamine 1-carboxyvinyltransferase [Ruminococcus sp. YE71]|nr:UDP-N-acetylglucosamine 1-carboxyvinyltransferase [Ruminococcus sp. YE78]SFW28599.1 UDP-N-acetylglucosamine 1-carboxyvinyltransferase [Ruminococcus sp. YE71]
MWTTLEKIVIKGGSPLKGEVHISAAKNAVLPIVAATILCDEPVILENVPQISDITFCLKILRSMGAEVKLINKNRVMFDTRSITNPKVPYEMATKMRASSYFLGALLGRFHEAHVAMPGGCDLGDRPIDQHLKAFRALGATDTLESGEVSLYADELIGSLVYFDMNSVGATINAMLAAVKAESLTVLENCAKEPHIVDVANFLNSMGADIMGAGTDTIKIRGVKKLKGIEYSVIPDQIEAGTFMAAAAITGGDVLVKNVIPKHLESITQALRKIGVTVDEFDDYVRVHVEGELKAAKLKTMPHPGFPTDMQPQISTLLTLANGASVVTEAIFDNRFAYAKELRRMGADITVSGKAVLINGVDKLKGAPVNASDLRAGAALVIAGLAADGTTEIGNIHFIQRGYENIVEKFKELGADIKYSHYPDLGEGEIKREA